MGTIELASEAARALWPLVAAATGGVAQAAGTELLGRRILQRFRPSDPSGHAVADEQALRDLLHYELDRDPLFRAEVVRFLTAEPSVRISGDGNTVDQVNGDDNTVTTSTSYTFNNGGTHVGAGATNSTFDLRDTHR